MDRKRLAVSLAALAATAVLLWLLHAPILRSLYGFLVTEDSPVGRADLIVVHGGEVDVRPGKALELWRGGVAPRVAFPREPPTRPVRVGVRWSGDRISGETLVASGVPASAIVYLDFPGGVRSTADEAVALRRWLEARGGRDTVRVVAVTHRWHLRRARWNLRRTLRGLPVEVRMAGVKDPGFDERAWWRSEAGLSTVVTEYLRFGHNLAYR